jgi:hypothetical protein
LLSLLVYRQQDMEETAAVVVEETAAVVVVESEA